MRQYNMHHLRVLVSTLVLGTVACSYSEVYLSTKDKSFSSEGNSHGSGRTHVAGGKTWEIGEGYDVTALYLCWEYDMSAKDKSVNAWRADVTWNMNLVGEEGESALMWKDKTLSHQESSNGICKVFTQAEGAQLAKQLAEDLSVEEPFSKLGEISIDFNSTVEYKNNEAEFTETMTISNYLYIDDQDFVHSGDSLGGTAMYSMFSYGFIVREDMENLQLIINVDVVSGYRLKYNRLEVVEDVNFDSVIRISWDMMLDDSGGLTNSVATVGSVKAGSVIYVTMSTLVPEPNTIGAFSIELIPHPFDDDDTDDGLTDTVTAGIGVGVGAGFLLLAGGGYFLYKRRSKKDQTQEDSYAAFKDPHWDGRDSAWEAPMQTATAEVL